MSRGGAYNYSVTFGSYGTCNASWRKVCGKFVAGSFNDFSGSSVGREFMKWKVNYVVRYVLVDKLD